MPLPCSPETTVYNYHAIFKAIVNKTSFQKSAWHIILGFNKAFKFFIGFRKSGLEMNFKKTNLKMGMIICAGSDYRIQSTELYLFNVAKKFWEDRIPYYLNNKSTNLIWQCCSNVSDCFSIFPSANYLKVLIYDIKI